MSVRTVAKKDFKSARRSGALWAVATLLALLTTLIAYGYQGYGRSATEEVIQLFRMLVMILAVLLPIIALVASYMAIAGERENGRIKFLLGFPNTRRDVFLGKLLSRSAVVGAGLTFMFGTATTAAVARHGALPIGTVIGLFVLSVIYSSVFVAIAVALSSVVATRSHAIGAAIVSYFGLVLLYVVPGVRITTVVRWLHHTMLGFESNPDLYHAVTYTSPYIAYQKATNLLFPPNMQQRVFNHSLASDGDLPAYLQNEVALVIFAVWLVVPLVLGYRRFERSDLQ